MTCPAVQCSQEASNDLPLQVMQPMGAAPRRRGADGVWPFTRGQPVHADKHALCRRLHKIRQLQWGNWAVRVPVWPDRCALFLAHRIVRLRHCEGMCTRWLAHRHALQTQARHARSALPLHATALPLKGRCHTTACGGCQRGHCGCHTQRTKG